MDHNMDLLKSGNHCYTRTFLEDLTDKKIMPAITHPTCIMQSTATLIDNIFVSENLQKYFESAVILDDISDHLPTLALLKQTKLLDTKPLVFKSQNLSKEKIAKIKTKLYEVDWTRHLDANNCSKNFDLFLSKVNEIIDTISSVKSVKISAKRKYVEPWMTQGLEISGCNKKCLYKKTLQSDANDIAITKYKAYRNHYNKAKRELKTTYYRNKANECLNDTRKLWSLLNEVIDKTKRHGSIIPYITTDGLKTYTPSKITNGFGKFYSSLGANLAAKINKGHYDINHYLSKIPRNISSLVLRSASVYEIEKLIHALPTKSSHGHDQISNILLKELNLSVSFLSISEGKFPAAMKKAKVIPLYKGKDQDQVVNCWPISLLVTISKILEKIIYKRVYDFLEKEKILDKSQYGFRSKHSCEQAILELTGKILQAKEQNLESAALFLDLSKAFDILDHEVLLVKLERYGIRGICNDWFHSYISNRMLTTKVQTSENKITKSDSYDINYCTAQGSCLGPLLFILFANDIYLLPTFSSIILFADDTTLFNSAKNTNFL